MDAMMVIDRAVEVSDRFEIPPLDHADTWMSIEHPLIFYPSYVVEAISKVAKYASAGLHAGWLYWIISRGPGKLEYADVATEPVEESAVEPLSLFTVGAGDRIELAPKPLPGPKK